MDVHDDTSVPLLRRRSSRTTSISWAKRMTFWPLSKSTVKSSRPRFSRCETKVPGVARRTIPPGNTTVRVARHRVRGTTDMAFLPLLRSRFREGRQVEPRALEGPTQAHVAAVHHVDDGRNQLGFRAGRLGDRI